MDPSSDDCEIVASLLAAAGHEAPKTLNNRLQMRTKFDRYGRVTELTLGSKNNTVTAMDDNNDAHQTIFWHLPSSIGKLDKLRRLVLCHCQSLPMSFWQLPNLECLELYQCRGVHPNFIPTSSPSSSLPKNLFSSLLNLEIHGGIWDVPSMDNWMKWITTFNNLSRLEELRFCFLNDKLFDVVLDNLAIHQHDIKAPENSIISKHQHHVVSFQDALKRLAWIHSEMTDQGLEKMLLRVVPFYPTLTSLAVPGNRIQSLQFLLKIKENRQSRSNNIAQRQQKQQQQQQRQQQTSIEALPNVITDSTLTFYGNLQHHSALSYSLRTLNVQHNPIMKQRTRHPRERQAFELLLGTYFPLLGSLSPTWEDWDAPIEYLLRINRGGRILLEGTTASSSSTTTRQRNKRQSVISLSIWPIVLERAYATSSKGFLPRRENATALYYLVRNGLVGVLVGRRWQTTE